MCLKENTGNIFKGFVQVHWLSARLTERPIFSYLKNLAEKNRSKIDRISKNPWQFNRFLELCRQTVEGIKNIVNLKIRWVIIEFGLLRRANYIKP